MTNAPNEPAVLGTVDERIRRWLDGEVEQTSSVLLRESAAEIERLRGCLLWLLWGHQGGSSPVGQPIRRALGIDAHASMTPEQIDAGQRFGVMPV